MIGAGAFAVFALGLRHGADPDHLAAIDNLTRNSFDERPWLSRFCGTMFAGGHSVMVLSIAGLVGFLGARFAGHGALIETIGTWISIVVLVAIAGFAFSHPFGHHAESLAPDHATAKGAA